MAKTTRRSLIAVGAAMSVMVAYPAIADEPAPTGGEIQTTDFLASLRAEFVAPLTHDNYVELATPLQVEAAALQAIASTEMSPATGYDENGRPRVLFEPHVFARLTNGRFNASHPTISYSAWDASRYPRTQDGRWEQIAEAYALAPDEALAATSWGAFQMMGSQYRTAGYATVQAFVVDVARSPQHELAAWVRWLQASGLVDEVQRKDWAGFARAYNGSGYAERGYDRRMAEAYARLTTTAN